MQVKAAELVRLLFDLPADTAEKSLKRFSEQSGREVLFASQITRGIRANPVKGDLVPQEAIDRLLANTGLVAVHDPKTGAFSVRNETPEERADRLKAAGDRSLHSQKKNEAKLPPNQEPMKSPKLFVKLAAIFVLAVAPSGMAAESGTIQGRVSNSSKDAYLEKARITVEGTALETLTDTGGFYRLTNVPAGTVKVTATYTGLEAVTTTASVVAGKTSQLDISLGVDADRTMRMSEFVVSTSREMEAAAIAINEQRFAPNIKSVVSTDEFGNVAEGSVGDFLKYLPGITIEYEGGALARGVSINGVPSTNVPVTVNGFSLASAGGNNGTARGVQLDMASITATSRIEVNYSPTPESQGTALAGSVNMVPRSAFERSRPEFMSSVYVMMRDSARSLRKTPGPLESATHKIKPGFDFSYIRPVNRNFGFTLSGGHSENGEKEEIMQNTWRGVSAATNGGAFPHTTVDRPYLTGTNAGDGTKIAKRTSFGATVEYRLSPNDLLSFSYQHYYIDYLVANSSIAFNITGVAPGNFTPFSTRGTAGQGTLQLTNVYRDRTNSTATPSLVWRHDGPVWKLEAGAGLSRGRNTFRATDKGSFSNSTAQRTGVTLSFADIFYLRPNTITVADATGTTALDPYDINNYVVTQATSNPITTIVLQKGANASVQRDFSGPRRFGLKAGVDFRQDMRDQRQANFTYTFVGADGRASTTPIGNDDGAGRFFAAGASQRSMPFGFPPVQWVDNARLWSYYQANPTHMTLNGSAQYRSFVNGSKFADELVSAAYVRGDLQLLDRRLKLIGGARAEQTNVHAQGPLTDPTRNFRRDANGRVILVNGSPALIVPTSDALGVSQLTVIDRGARVEKEYLRWFPSLNASFNLRENLIARAAYYFSIGRPNFNQYAGGITLPNDELPPSPGNRIAVNNAAIKPWSAKSVTARLEYYFEGVGMVSVGAFQREFENFFGNTIFQPTPDFLTLYGLDANTYGRYEVSTQHNVKDTVRMSGVDFSYKQALTFLPRWARGVHVFANAASQRATGDATANFEGYIPRKASWGFSLVREKFNFRVNSSYQSRNRGSAVTGASIEPGTYNWTSSRVNVDILGEYYLTKRFALYFNLRNVGDTPTQNQIEGPNTPAHARFRLRELDGALWTFGVKGTF